MKAPGRLVRMAALLLVASVLGACGGSSHAPDPAASAGSTSGPAEVPFPEFLTAYVDQSRVQRVGRTVFVRLVNADRVPVTVTRAEISSDRFDDIVWTGEKDVTYEGDLDVELPAGRCGTGSDADVRLTYRVDGGPEVVSQTRATDRYGAVGLFLERDCAAQTLAEAADLSVGQHRVVGTGRDSQYVLPVTITATGARDDVAFAGFDGTVLFSTVAPTPVWGTAREVPLVAGYDAEVALHLVPSRCDPHALAEDKVGTLVGVHVTAPGLPAGAASYLPISDEARADLRGFFATHCGL